MTNLLETAIRNLEGKLTVARDKAKHYRDQAEFYDRQVVMLDAAVNAIVEVMGGPAEESFTNVFEAVEERTADIAAGNAMADAADVQREVVAEAAKPFQNNGRHARNTPVFNRDIIRRELRARHIRYPLAPSHRSSTHFVRQSMVAACVNHPDYQAYLDAGGDDLLNPHTKTNVCVDMAVAHLQVDTEKVRDDALVLHQLIYTCGIEGVDYR